MSYWYPQKALSQLGKLIPYCTDITVAVGLPVRIQDKVYNTVAVIENGKLKGFVAKQFMAIDGVHYEFRWFTPWEANQVIDFEFEGKKVPLGDLTFNHSGIHYGFEICEDAGEVKYARDIDFMIAKLTLFSIPVPRILPWAKHWSGKNSSSIALKSSIAIIATSIYWEMKPDE